VLDRTVLKHNIGSIHSVSTQLQSKECNVPVNTRLTKVQAVGYLILGIIALIQQVFQPIDYSFKEQN